MSRRPRSSNAPGFFHVINRSVRKTPLFQRPTDYRAFIGVLAEGLARRPARLISYCVLANHWHLVLGPIGIKELSSLVQWVSATHAVRWHRHRNSVGQGPVYQGRFKSHAIEATGQLMRTCRYVERNALRAGLVRRAQDWPWCSLSERFSDGIRLPLVSTPFLASDTWVKYVNAAIFPGEDEARQSISVPIAAEIVENSSVPLDDGAKTPGTLARGLKRVQDEVRIVRAADHHQADAHVKGAKHLGLRDPAAARQPRENRRHGPATAVE
jgi:putative transposase